MKPITLYVMIALKHWSEFNYWSVWFVDESINSLKALTTWPSEGHVKYDVI